MPGVDQQRAAGFTMALTYAFGALGIGLAFSTAFSAEPSLRWGCLFAVGVAGVLSFVRHSLLDRGDATRMGWDNGKPNPFQIEVGLANLAWGILAILAVELFPEVGEQRRGDTGEPVVVQHVRGNLPAGALADAGPFA